MSISSSPPPWVIKSFTCSWKGVSPESRVTAKVMENGPPQPTILPATSMREPITSPRAIMSRTLINVPSSP